MRRHLAVIAICAGLTMGTASCGGPTTTSSTSTVGPSGPVSDITTAKVHGLGSVLVDGQGYTLYLFVPDAHSAHSTCTGICAVEWPPLTLPTGTSAPKAGPGVDPSLLGTTTRTDGSVQVTYNGWPLYTWPDDISPGQATGQGLNNVGGLWYVVSPQGNPIRS